MDRRETLRILAVVLSVLAGAVHLALALFNLIPGENTVGLVFAGMGIGYFIGAAGIALGKTVFYRLVIFYAVALILAYAASRGALPVEPIGLLAKLDEGLLVLSLIQLLRMKSPIQP